MRLLLMAEPRHSYGTHSLSSQALEVHACIPFHPFGVREWEVGELGQEHRLVVTRVVSPSDDEIEQPLVRPHLKLGGPLALLLFDLLAAVEAVEVGYPLEDVLLFAELAKVVALERFGRE